MGRAMMQVGTGRAGAGELGVGYVQLLEPLASRTPVGTFLARRGEGLHHVGYGVADVRQALTAIGGTGIRLIDERPRHGSMGASIAFLHPADLGGVLTELVQAGAARRNWMLGRMLDRAKRPILAFWGFNRAHRIENSEGRANTPK